MSYLKDVPFLAHCTKTALGKFSYFFKEQSFRRGQTVFSEGEAPKKIFIVKEGEFELSKRMRGTKERKIDYTEFLSQFPHNKSKSNKERIIALNHPVEKNFKDETSHFNVSRGLSQLSLDITPGKRQHLRRRRCPQRTLLHQVMHMLLNWRSLICCACRWIH